MATIIADPEIEERIIAERQARGWDRKDEVWEGVYIIVPNPNIEHQEIVSALTGAFRDVVHPPKGGRVLPGFNLSDRVDDWKHNYRCSDVGVLLAGNRAQVFDSHICGPADFLVEIVSPGDKSREKLDFYGSLVVSEVLLIDRSPWSLELYRHDGRELVLAGRSTVQRSDELRSEILPLSFQLLPAAPRPEIHIAELHGARSWTA